MIKIEKTTCYGFEEAIRGMRNPKNSWDRSDSYKTHIENPDTLNTADFAYFVGENDHKLMMSLAKGGAVHAKYRRYIDVYVDVTAPLYWWKEFDTYRTAFAPNPFDIEMNSCSTMHKIPEKEFTLDDFSSDYLISADIGSNIEACSTWINNADGSEHLFTPAYILKLTIDILNANRRAYLDTKEKKYWWQMIQLLPTSYNQKRTLKLNYETLANMYEYRQNHKLDEWREFCSWIDSLPYSEIITGKEESEASDECAACKINL